MRIISSSENCFYSRSYRLNTLIENLSSPSTKYLTGWSHGKEILKAGQYDTHKGSFYVNCGTFYHPATRSATSPPPPEPNLWPPEDLLQGFRSTFEELCTLVIDITVLVARACDRYAEFNIEAYEKGYLERVVKDSMTTKARLLHYFPPSTEAVEHEEEKEDVDSWCATHVDHGCLTGLTSALYIAEPPTLPPFPSSLPTLSSSPDPLAGLYIRSRTSETIKVDIPPSHLAFQTGEALELITKGKFKAVPHFVRAPRKRYMGNIGEGVARNTLAVFTQPNLEELVDVEKGITFGEFARSIGERHQG